MRDPTGTNWLTHFLHGTSTMLRLLGPSVLISHSGENTHRQAFFFSARIFELSRALIYTEHTFLATTQWTTAIEAYWAVNPRLRTPKEALLDMVPLFASLGIRVLHFISLAGSPALYRRACAARTLAQEGLALQQRLQQWVFRSSNIPSSTDASASAPDEDALIARAYYHALSIYLDGIFSYHPPFTTPPAPQSPTLNPPTIQNHLACILSTCHQLLERRCAGLVLFFPLRVAGARARDLHSRSEIMRLLGLIAQRGFSVAASFIGDLEGLWARS
jgi:hypothetical protein